jgi:hypothetical protein
MQHAATDTRLLAMSGQPIESDHSEMLLPWESAAEFRTLRGAFEREHAPKGATEQALVARLAWIEWRRRRLALAERATHMAALAERLNASARTLERAGVRSKAARERIDIAEVVSAAPADEAREAARHDADRKSTQRALAILDRGGAGAYDRALAALHEDTRAWWEDGVAGEYGTDRVWAPTEAALGAFLREEVGPADEAIAVGDAARPAVRLQAFGESLDPDRLERLMAIDARLDRQFEKALSMLIQLQRLRLELRRSPPARLAAARG